MLVLFIIQFFEFAWIMTNKKQPQESDCASV